MAPNLHHLFFFFFFCFPFFAFLFLKLIGAGIFLLVHLDVELGLDTSPGTNNSSVSRQQGCKGGQLEQTVGHESNTASI